MPLVEYTGGLHLLVVRSVFLYSVNRQVYLDSKTFRIRADCTYFESFVIEVFFTINYILEVSYGEKYAGKVLPA